MLLGEPKERKRGAEKKNTHLYPLQCLKSFCSTETKTIEEITKKKM